MFMRRNVVQTSNLETGYVVRWIEADVVEVDVLEQENIYRRLSCRVFGMNAPEPRGVTEEVAARAKEHVASLTKDKTLSFIFLHLPDNFLVPPRFKKYGRTMIRIFLPDGAELAETMVESGLAVPYFMGIGKQPKPPSVTR
jgi:endonuclease YncB( thermonuclease family)